MWHTLEQHQGARLSEVSFPANIVATGVPFIERIANRDIEISGMKVSRDQKIRLVLDTTSRAMSGTETDLFFGKGRHLCVGKPMTLIVWRSLAKALNALPLRFTLGEMKFRGGDYAFNYPEYARITLHD